MSKDGMTTLAENLERIEDAITAACRRTGRGRGEVELMAVSKTFPAEAIVEAAERGLRLFGESRVQEFAAKAASIVSLRQSAVSLRQSATIDGCPILSELHQEREGDQASPLNSVRIHLIGHLQTNKAARAAELFDAVDSVDSLRLAERLNEAAGKLGKRLPVLIEVKLSPEESKAGLVPESAEAAALLEALPGLHSLEACGLMTIAPWGVAEDVTRACFRSLREWRDRWAAAHSRLNLKVLSMGMSGDFELAIAEGATRVRIGTALFGKRPPMAAQLKAYPEEPGE